MIKTECPHCHTVFRVSETVIAQGEGQVRCGHCLAIFAPILVTDDVHVEDQGNVQVDIDSEAIAVNEVDGSETGTAHQPEDISSPELAEVEARPEPEPLFVESPAPVLPDVIPPALRAETRGVEARASWVSTLLWVTSVWLLILAAVMQYAWYNRMQLLQNPQLRPWYERACAYLSCEIPEPKDTARIELIRKNIYTHPNDEHGLMVSGTMINQAEFEQDFPLLELRFENARGEAVAARRFTPNEYLDLPQDQINKMQPGVPVSFTLEVIDPGADVVSYEFAFL